MDFYYNRTIIVVIIEDDRKGDNMAVCKRCGKTFDYEKREGVCPKCCFYNRPTGTWQEDDSWIKNYNYEDNSYNVTVSSEDGYDTKEEKRSRYHMEKEKKNEYRHFSKEVDGSHSHLSDGRVVRGSDPAGRKTSVQKRKKQKSASPKKSKISWVFIFLLIYWIFFIVGTLFGFL